MCGKISVENEDVFRDEFIKRVKDCSFQNWQSLIVQSRKLDVYGKVKDSIELSKYLVVLRSKSHRSIMSRFRCSSHSQAI